MLEYAFKFRVGDKVKIIHGPHKGKLGHVLCNRGGNVSGWITVRLHDYNYRTGMSVTFDNLSYTSIKLSHVEKICSSFDGINI